MFRKRLQSEAHSAGRLHRDVKPENIIVGRDSRIWSISGSPTRLPDEKFTERGTAVGNYAYMPPSGSPTTK